MKNVIEYLKLKILEAENQIQALVDERKNGYQHWSSGLQSHDQKIMMIQSNVVNLQKLLDEALNAQRRLDASKRQ
ncbi:MAG: hypothetical protein AAB568_02110 [Patescibacteria group bacterium]